MNLSFSVHRSTGNRRQLLEKKINEPEKSNGNVEKLVAHCVFFCVEKLLQSAKVPS